MKKIYLSIMVISLIIPVSALFAQDPPRNLRLVPEDQFPDYTGDFFYVGPIHNEHGLRIKWDKPYNTSVDRYDINILDGLSALFSNPCDLSDSIKTTRTSTTIPMPFADAKYLFNMYHIEVQTRAWENHWFFGKRLKKGKVARIQIRIDPYYPYLTPLLLGDSMVNRYIKPTDAGKQRGSWFHGTIRWEGGVADLGVGVKKEDCSFTCSDPDIIITEVPQEDDGRMSHDPFIFEADTLKAAADHFYFYIKLKDRVGNESPKYKVYVQIDNQSPPAIDPASFSLNSTPIQINNGNERVVQVIKQIDAAWQPVQDLPSTEVKALYNISAKPLNFTHSRDNVESFELPSRNLNLGNGTGELQRDTAYKLAVHTEDEFGNRCQLYDNNNNPAGDYWRELPYPVYFKNPVTINHVSTEIIRDSFPPEFRVTVNLQITKEQCMLPADVITYYDNQYQYAIDGLKIFYGDQEITNGNNFKLSHIMHLTPDELQDGLGWEETSPETGSKLSYVFQLPSGQFPHALRDILVKTVHPGYLGGAEEYIDHTGNLPGSSYYSIRTPNYPASFQLAVFQNALIDENDENNEFWLDSLNVITEGNTLIKNIATTIWDAGATSREVFTGDGGVEFTAAQIDKMVISCGLTTRNINSLFSTTDFTIIIDGAGWASAYENGVNKAAALYAIGDKFRIIREGSDIAYLRNGFEFYRSTAVINPVEELMIDSTLLHPESKISNVQWTPGTQAYPSSIYEKVREWTVPTGVTITDNNISKENGIENWDSGVGSAEGFTGNGGVEFIASQPDKWVACGLSVNEVNAHFNSIDYVILLTAQQRIMIFEHGVRLLPEMDKIYNVGNVFQVLREGNDIVYKQGTEEIYRLIEVIAPGQKLFIDTSIATPGGKISNIKWIKATESFWLDTLNVTVDSHTLIKNNATVAWDAGATSQALFTGDGGVEFTAAQTDKMVSCGLTSGNINSLYYSTDFTIAINGDGYANALENGVNKAVSLYAIGDKFRIIRDGGDIVYMQNGSEFYRSAAAIDPAMELMVDCTLLHPGSILEDVQWVAGTQAVPSSILKKVQKWTSSTGVTIIDNNITKENGIENWDSGTFSTDGFTENGGVEFIPPQEDKWVACGLSLTDTNANFNTIDFAFVLAPNQRVMIFERGVRLLQGVDRIYNTGNVFRVIREGSDIVYIHGNEEICRHSEAITTDKELFIDTTLASPGGSLNNIKWINSTPSFWLDTFNVAVDSHTLIKNNTTVAWDSGATSREVFSDDGGVEFKAAQTDKLVSCGLTTRNINSLYYSTDFTIAINGDGYANALEGGVNKAVSLYAIGDKFQIIREGSDIVFIQNGLEFYRSADVIDPAAELMVDCTLMHPGSILENVHWVAGTYSYPSPFFEKVQKWTPQAGVTVTDNNIIKETGIEAWDSGSFSAEGFTGNRGVEFIAPQTDKWVGCGLSRTDTNADYNTIDYALLLAPNQRVMIFEQGVRLLPEVDRVYNTGNVFRIIREGSDIVYIHGNEEIYRHIEAVTPGQKLFIDTSLFSPGGSISNLKWINSNQIPWSAGVNVDILGSVLSKNSPTSNWDAGAFSALGFAGNGGIEFTPARDDTQLGCGLSFVDTDTDYTSINFALLLTDQQKIEIYELGNRQNPGLDFTYAAGDEFRITRQGYNIFYEHNGDLIYKSAIQVDPQAELFADTALFNPQSGLSEAKWIRIREEDSHYRKIDVIYNENTGEYSLGDYNPLFYIDRLFLRVEDTENFEGDRVKIRVKEDMTAMDFTRVIDLKQALAGTTQAVPGTGDFSFMLQFRDENENFTGEEVEFSLTFNINTGKPSVSHGTDFRVTDSVGNPLPVHSGIIYTVDTGIKIWDLLISNADEILIQGAASGDFSLPVGYSQASALTIIDIPAFNLPSEEGMKTITLTPLNSAGKVGTKKTVGIYYDPDDPEISLQDFSIDHGAGGNIIVNLESELTELYYYDIDYPVDAAGLTYNTLQVPATDAFFTIDTNDLDDNTVYTLSITAIACSGRESAALNLDVATLPAVGKLAPVPLQDGTSLIWTFTDSGKSHEYALQEVTEDGNVITTHPRIPGAELNEIRVNGLTASTQYYFRLIGYNPLGDALEGETYQWQLDNSPPDWSDSTLITNPPAYSLDNQRFLKNNFTLHWDAAVDPDENPTEYKVQYRETGSSSWNDWQLEWFSDTYFEYQTENLLHNTSYDFRVLARDDSTLEGSENFLIMTDLTIDAQLPQVSYQKPVFPASDPELELDITDNLTGIRTVTYDLIRDGEILLTGVPLPQVYNENDNSYGYIGSYSLAALNQAAVSSGIYTLHLKVEDNTGNYRGLNITDIYTDTDKPVLNFSSFELAETSFTGLVPFTIDLEDEIAGVKSLYYSFVTNPDVVPCDLSGALVVNLSDSAADDGLGNKISLNKYDLLLNGENGLCYYLALQVEDWAGNRTAVTVIKDLSVWLDTTPPEGWFNLVGLQQEGSRFYWNKNLYTDVSQTISLELTAAAEIKDDESDIFSIQYGIGAVNNAGEPQITVWFDSLEEADMNINYTHGELYKTSVRVTNGVQNSRDFLSQGFIYDNAQLTADQDAALQLKTAAGNYALTAYDAGTNPASIPVLTPYQPIILKAAAYFDQITPVTEFRIGIKTPGREDYLFTTNLAGNRDGWLVQKKPNKVIETITGNFIYGTEAEFYIQVPVLADGLYLIDWEVSNCVANNGNTGINNYLNRRSAIRIESGAGGLLVTDNGPWVFNADADLPSLEAEWLPQAGALGYQYRVMEEGNPQAVQDWSETITDTRVQTSGDYETGKEYYFEVIPVTDDNQFPDYAAAVRSLPGVRFDYSQPVIVSLETPDLSSPEQVFLDWHVDDPESGIAQVEAMVVKAELLPDPSIITDEKFFNWQEITTGWQKLNIDMLGSPLSGNDITGRDDIRLLDTLASHVTLESGDKVHILLRVINNCQAEALILSKAITLDTTVPPRPLVIDQGDSIRPGELPVFSLALTQQDPESGTTGFKWAVIRSSSDLQNCRWLDLPYTRELDFSNLTELPVHFTQIHGDKWYLAVKAINALGMESVPSLSNGIVYDDTAPLISRVKFLQEVTPADATGALSVSYLTSISGDLYGYITAHEDFTNISGYSLHIGKLDENLQWLPLTGHSILNQDLTSGTVDSPGHFDLGPLQISEIEPGSDILVLKGEAWNTNGERTAGYSSGSIIDPNPPSIKNFTAFVHEGKIHCNWTLVPSQAPLKKLQFLFAEVSADNNFPGPEENWLDEGLIERRYLEDCSIYPPGKYKAYLILEDVCDKLTTAESNILVLDHTPPVYDTGSFDYTTSVSSLLIFDISFTEAESYIDEYMYALGTAGQPSLYSGNWQHISRRTASLLEYPLDLTTLPTSIPDQSEFYLRIKAKNSAGLWSETVVSNPIRLDRQQPSTPVVIHATGVTREPTRINNIAVTSYGSRLGITAYRTRIISPDIQAETFAQGLGGQEEILLPDARGRLLLTDLVVKTDTATEMTVERPYMVAAQTMSYTGVWSEVGFSQPVIADFSSPVVQLTGDSPLVINNYKNLGETVTVNAPLFVPMIVTDNYPGAIQLTFRLSRDGTVTDLGERTLLPSQLSKPILLAFDLGSHTLPYGYYDFEVQVRDLAGNTATIGKPQGMLINTPPEVKLNNIVVTPGQSAAFMQELYIFDPDDPVNGFYTPSETVHKHHFKYEWDFGNNDTLVFDPFDPLQPDSPADWTEPLRAYTENTPPLTVSLKITDAAGASTTVSSTVYILNTSAGQLQGDEIWDTDHAMTGDVIIPAGITLTIENSTILVTGPYKLIIYGKLVMNPGAVITHRNEGRNPDDWWEGIFLEKGDDVLTNVTVLNGATIKRARKGLTINNDSPGASKEITITDCRFDNNLTGLHAVGGNWTLSGCVFINNQRYGVKEDSEVNLNLVNCAFIDNIYDYYDDDLTVIENIEAAQQ